MNYWFFLLPLIAALLGWIIHSIAIHFFFQYLLPQKKKALAKKIGTAAATEFASYKGLEEKVNDPKHFESIRPVIETHIDRFLNEKLKEEMPMISMFIGSKTTDKLKEVFIRELETLFPQVIGQFASNLKSSIDIEDIIIKRLDAVSPETFSLMIKSNLSAELKYVRLLGAVSGFIIGIILVLVTVLTN
jgi:uncharacterized membrane protein YheB (UPF0754 family)